MTVLDEESDSGDEWEAPKQAAGAHAESGRRCERPGAKSPSLLTLNYHGTFTGSSVAVTA